MKNYALSGYILGVLWGWMYGAFRWRIPDDLSNLEVVAIVFFLPLVSTGLIGAVSGLVAGFALHQHQRARLKDPAKPKHQL